jgi:hypothetical protein
MQAGISMAAPQGSERSVSTEAPVPPLNAGATSSSQRFYSSRFYQPSQPKLKPNWRKIGCGINKPLVLLELLLHR